MDFQYRIKMLEAFKDGNILNGRLLKANEVLNVSESDMVKIRNSGGLLEILETLIPNPLKKADPAVIEALAEQELEDEAEEKAREGEKRQAAEKIARPAKEAPRSNEELAKKQLKRGKKNA